MLRELVEGSSLEDVLQRESSPWLEAIATACDQLTVVHRAGLLHGDIKPANVIVGADGRGTLVDLGLAAPWRDGGATAQGLTPKYAAPELFQGRAADGARRGLLARRHAGRGAGPAGRRAARGLSQGAGAGRRAGERAGDGRPVAQRRRAGERAAASGGPAARCPERYAAVAGARARGDGPRPARAGTVDVRGRRNRARGAARIGQVDARAPACLDARGRRKRRGRDRGPQGRHADWRRGRARARAVRRGRGRRPCSEAPDRHRRRRRADRRGRRAGAPQGFGGRRAARGRRPAQRSREDGRRRAGGFRRAPARRPRGRRARAACRAVSARDAARAPRRAHGRPARSAARRRAPARGPGDRLEGGGRRGARRPCAAVAPSAPPSQAGRAQAFDEVERALDMGRFDEAARGLAGIGAPRGSADQVRLATGAGPDRDRARRRRRARSRSSATVERAALEGPFRRGWQALKARACLRAGAYAEAASLAKAVVDASTGRRARGRGAERPRRGPRLHRGRRGGARDARRRDPRGPRARRPPRRGRRPRFVRHRSPARRAQRERPRRVRSGAHRRREGARRRDGCDHAPEPRRSGAGARAISRRRSGTSRPRSTWGGARAAAPP